MAGPLRPFLAQAQPNGGPAAPLVVSVTDDGFFNAVVVFDQPVTWSVSGSGTFQINATPGSWTGQLSATSLQFTPGVPFLTGDPWDWSGPDPELTPVPDDTQTGTVS